MTLSRDDVEHVATLARLGLTDEEKDLVARDADQYGQGMSAEESAVHVRRV